MTSLRDEFISGATCALGYGLVLLIILWIISVARSKPSP